jgi:2-keto-4-pentenoate hydratase/2-oxohepta-3-ene-1,7-dioic acid hydratase in catechol pathway
MDKIICLGKNYLEHAKELGESVPEKPVIFIKPASVLKAADPTSRVLQLSLPAGKGEVHHECEIVVRIGKGGENLTPAEAEKTIESVTLGLDMTLRDVQSKLKKLGQPWTISKVFKDSAVVGPWLRPSDFPSWESEKFYFNLNGKLKQSASAKEMMMKVKEGISYISEHFPLFPGDLIFTGTPSGVGPVVPGSSAELKWGPLSYEVLWK